MNAGTNYGRAFLTRLQVGQISLRKLIDSGVRVHVHTPHKQTWAIVSSNGSSASEQANQRQV